MRLTRKGLAEKNAAEVHDTQSEWELLEADQRGAFAWLIRASGRSTAQSGSTPSYANERDFLCREKTYPSSFYARALLGWEFLRCRCFFNCSTKTKVFSAFLFVRRNVGTPPAMCFRYAEMLRCLSCVGKKQLARSTFCDAARLQLFVFVIGKNAEGVIKALFPRRKHFLYLLAWELSRFFLQKRAKNNAPPHHVKTSA